MSSAVRDVFPLFASPSANRRCSTSSGTQNNYEEINSGEHNIIIITDGEYKEPNFREHKKKTHNHSRGAHNITNSLRRNTCIGGTHITISIGEYKQ